MLVKNPYFLQRVSINLFKNSLWDTSGGVVSKLGFGLAKRWKSVQRRGWEGKGGVRNSSSVERSLVSHD